MESHDDDADAQRRRWRSGAIWSALFIIGLLAYELTSDPGLAAAISCLKFGWEDFRTALWLRRVDPDRLRGRTCFWFYVAYGQWKVALCAVGLMFGLELFIHSIANWQGVPVARGGVLPSTPGIFLASALAFGLSFATAAVGLRLAFINRIKIWIGAAPHFARRRRYWPPSQGKTNGIRRFILTWFILSLAFTVVALFNIDIVVAPNKPILRILSSLLVVGASVLMLVVYAAADKHVFAATPLECWGSMPDEQVYQNEFVATDR